jgi:hypothetical protein
MKWSDFFLNPTWLLELPDDMERARRMRRASAQSQGDEIADLAEQNAQLRVLRSAVIALLGEKGILDVDDVHRKVKELAPQPASPPDENPFTGLER